MSAETPSGAAPEGRDEDFNYDVEYKSKCTGLGALLGAIRSQEDGEIFDDEDENAGGGGAGGSKKRKKTGRKRQHEDEQYYEQVCDTGQHQPREYPKHMRPERQAEGTMDCVICGITVTSAATYRMHIEGAKHLKKVRHEQKKKEALQKQKNMQDDNGGGAEGEAEEGQTFSQPPPTNDLRKMLCQTEEPVIGLHYVEELMPETNRDSYPPHYACGLCNVAAAPASSMFAHLTGLKHRTKYIAMRLAIRTADMDRVTAQEKARDLEAEDGLRIDLLKTVFSDNRYPWPAGKSPWAAEAANIAGCGGAGSSETANKEGDKVSLSDSPTVQLLVGISQCKVKNDEDAMMAHDVSAELIKRIVEYKAKMSAEKHAAALQGCCMSLLTSLNAIMNMPCGTQTQQQQQQQQPEEQQPQQQRPRQPQAAPPAASASAIATANSASSTNSSNASEHSSYHHRTGQTNNGSFEGGEHNSSSGYGSSAEAQGDPYSMYGQPPPPPPAPFGYPPPPPPEHGHAARHYHR